MTNRLKLLLLATLCICATTAVRKSGQDNTAENDRSGRVFSLFNVVQFKQESCTTTADSTMSGTCLTATECSSASGTASGNCASGFGVCCMFVNSCGTGTTATVNRNTQYPATAAASSSCTVTFNRICPNLCQIRLDFNNLLTALPATTGVNTGKCANLGDTVTVTSPLSASTAVGSTGTGSNPPVVCGNLNGQHMYLETGSGTGTAGQIAFKFGTATGTRTYKIKVTYYTCDSLAKAPAGCVQYFTGISGSFQSYNWQGNQYLDMQSYQTCIRQAKGYCKVSYSETASTSPDAFALLSLVRPSNQVNLQSSLSCNMNFLQISTDTSDRFCGGTLNAVSGMTVPGTVTGANVPFQVGTFSNLNTVTDATPANPGIVGYSLDYRQVPCF